MSTTRKKSNIELRIIKGLPRMDADRYIRGKKVFDLVFV